MSLRSAALLPFGENAGLAWGNDPIADAAAPWWERRSPFSLPPCDLGPSFRPTPVAPNPAPKPSAPTPPSPQVLAVAGQKAERLRVLVRDDDEDNQEEVIRLLWGASALELNLMLTRAGVATVFDMLDGREADSFRSIMSRTRLADLSIANRAAFVTALQRGHTDDDEEQAILDVFLGTNGLALTELKNRIDGTGDHHDLLQLLTKDIDDENIRNVILEHIAREGRAVPHQGVKVMSDIDDTFFANWVDKSFPGKQPYPGVRQFYRELALGPNGTVAGNPVFLTARPKDPTGGIEDAGHKTLQSFGVKGTLLSGDVLHMLGDSIRPAKVKNYELFRQLYPEYGTVWIGDSGQTDVQVGEDMLKANHGDMRGVFIHDVVGTPAARRAQYAQNGVYMFDSYVDAAARAHEQGLISSAGLQRIMDAAERDFAAMPFTDANQRAARRAELDAGLAKARARLGQV